MEVGISVKNAIGQEFTTQAVILQRMREEGRARAQYNGWGARSTCFPSPVYRACLRTIENQVIKQLDEEFERAVSVMNMRITGIIKRGRANITRSLEMSDAIPFPTDAAARLAMIDEEDDDAFYDELGRECREALMLCIGESS